jgi:hypothetical protein
MCLASKTNLNLDPLLCATVKGFTTYKPGYRETLRSKSFDGGT